MLRVCEIGLKVINYFATKYGFIVFCYSVTERLADFSVWVFYTELTIYSVANNRAVNDFQFVPPS